MVSASPIMPLLSDLARFTLLRPSNVDSISTGLLNRAKRARDGRGPPTGELVARTAPFFFDSVLRIRTGWIEVVFCV